MIRRAIGLALLTLLPAALPSDAATATAVTVALRFVPEQITIAPGDSLNLVNADVAPHNLVSKQSRRGVLLFTSATASTGGQVPVRGVEKLAPGAYPFFCSIHPTMLGTLMVARGGAGSALAGAPVGTVPTPTSIAHHDGALYAASYGTGTIERLGVLPGGALLPPVTYASGFSSPLGVTFAPDGTMFVADSHSDDGGALLGRVSAVPPGGGPAEVVVDGLPNGRHATNGMAVHRGRLIITNGNSTDDGVSGGPPEQPLSGTILSVPLRARGIDARRPGRALVVEARGLRNPYDVAVRPGTDEVWTPSNGPDALDPYGEDLLHRFDLRRPVVDFGFPACVYAATPEGPKVAQNPAIERPCSPRHERPVALLGLHVSADGIAFAPADGGWDGAAYIAEFGSFNGATGHAVVRVPVDSRGLAGEPETVWPGPAPLDLTFGPPGTGLYVADFATGHITLLVPAGAAAARR
ncbi:MAG TPA: cupredoxin domain-containing protein [Mycobacteriales bacterium]|nr:cupredoxin domain-containing protein [Mycobacteriales bacterium]